MEVSTVTLAAMIDQCNRNRLTGKGVSDHHYWYLLNTMHRFEPKVLTWDVFFPKIYHYTQNQWRFIL